MADQFEVFVVGVDEVRDLAGAWTVADSRALLERMELLDGSVTDADATDLAVMGLQELGAEAAAELLVEFMIEDAVSPGARGEIARDFVDDEPWNEHADLALHQPLWRVACVLQKAFPGEFSTPTLARAELGVVALTDEARAFLAHDPPVAWVARLLAGDGTTPVARLFAAEVAGAPFADAPSLVWRVDVSDRDLDDAEAPSIRLRVYGSTRWLDGLESCASFRTEAWADAEDDG